MEIKEVMKMIIQIDSFVGIRETRRVLDDSNRFGGRRFLTRTRMIGLMYVDRY